MSLLTCWKTCSLVQWYHCQSRLFWRRTSGLCRSCGLQLAGCNWKNHRINVVCLQNCYNMSPKNFWRLCFGSTIPCWKMGKFQVAGGQPVSTCCRKKCVLCMQVISGQLLTYVCCTRFLHIWFLVVSSIHLTPINPKNNMDSAQNTGLKSTCLQPICSLTKRQRTEYRFGW